MGSDAGWTAQAGSAKIINKGVKVDTYKKLQQQQTSQVFDLPEYYEHQSMRKQNLDVNNVADFKRKQHHMYSDLGNGSVSPAPKRVADMAPSNGDQ